MYPNLSLPFPSCTITITSLCIIINPTISTLTANPQVWVNYVASAPLQNATHQLRFPMVVSLLFLLVAFAIEVARVSLPAFKADARKWRRRDRTAAVNDDQGVVAEEEDSSSNNSASDAVVPERYNVGVGGEKA